MHHSWSAAFFLLASATFGSASPVQNTALPESSIACSGINSWSPDVAACTIARLDALELDANGRASHDDLAKRATNFISPHQQRALVVGLASHIITGANWVFNIWVNDATSGIQVWRSGVTTSTNLQEGNVFIPSLRTIYGSTFQYRGAATFQATGYVGTAELVVTFTAEVFASAAETIIQSMITPPSATLAGAEVGVTSWSFDAREA